MTGDLYGNDVLSNDRRAPLQPRTSDLVIALGMILEDPASGFVGEIMGWENGLIVLEDRHQRRRSFPVGPGFLYEGKPVKAIIPARQGKSRPRYTASGSYDMPSHRAKVALPSRIYVEGRHDAELVEKIWGDDLRHVGVVVEYLSGIDDLVGIVDRFAPEPGRRLGVLVDHLLKGTKEDRIVSQVKKSGYSDYVMITGHRYIDIWQAIKPQILGFSRWPDVPKDIDFKKGTLAALGLAHRDQSDIAQAWKAMLARVTTWKDLDIDLVREMEKLIDFVTSDHCES